MCIFIYRIKEANIFQGCLGVDALSQCHYIYIYIYIYPLKHTHRAFSYDQYLISRDPFHVGGSSDLDGPRLMFLSQTRQPAFNDILNVKGV